MTDSSAPGTLIGTVASISRFPVKSLQGEHPATTELTELGILGDRTFGFRDLESGKVLSAKQPDVGARLLTWSARYRNEPELTDREPVAEVTIDEATFTSDQVTELSHAASQALGREVRFEAATADPDEYEVYWPEVEGLTFSDVTNSFPIAAGTKKGTLVDFAGLHVLTTASLNHLQALAPESTITEQRFRPSLLIEVPDEPGFIENEWTGRTARLGSAELTFGPASPRCVMTTRAQRGLERDLNVLKTIARHNRQEWPRIGAFACLGVYAEVTTPGRAAIGDELAFI